MTRSNRPIRTFLMRAAALALGLAAATSAWHDPGGLALESTAHAQSAPPEVTMLTGIDPIAMALGPDDLMNCPGIPPGGLPGVTKDRFYFLSEVGCSNLPCFLAEVEGTEHANATLIVDEVCHVYQPIRIPSRFTLAGVGPAGEGALIFEDLPDYTAAISVAPAVPSNGVSEIVIRDLEIVRGSGGLWTPGINVSYGNIVAIEGVRVHGFTVGLYGRDAYSVLVNRSTFFGNAFNMMLHHNANGWRVRDSALGHATFYSVKIFGPSDDPNVGANDNLFSGVRFEGSGSGAMMLASEGAMLMNNRFEGNGYAGVWITPSAINTRVVGNYFETDTVNDSGADTKCGFNINLAQGACPLAL